MIYHLKLSAFSGQISKTWHHCKLRVGKHLQLENRVQFHRIANTLNYLHFVKLTLDNHYYSTEWSLLTFNW